MFKRKCYICKKKIFVENKYSSWLICETCKKENKYKLLRNNSKCNRCKNKVKSKGACIAGMLCEKCKKLLSNENLTNLAIRKWYSSKKIAKELNFSLATIKRFLRKYKIFEQKTKIRTEKRQKNDNIIFENIRRPDRNQLIPKTCINCGKQVLRNKFSSYILCEDCKKIPKHKRKIVLVTKKCLTCSREVNVNAHNVRPKCDYCKKQNLTFEEHRFSLDNEDYDSYINFCSSLKSENYIYLSSFEYSISNYLKQKIDNIVYVGSVKKGLKWFGFQLKNGKLKIPDFIVLDKTYYQDNKHKFISLNKIDLQNFIVDEYKTGNLHVSKVIEANGGWFHKTKEHTYKDFLNDHKLWEKEENIMINFYKEIGIDCFVIWDFLWYKNKEIVFKQLEAFLNSAS